MIAMELDGRHVGHTVKITHIKDATTQVGYKKNLFVVTKKIVKLVHYGNGDVSITQDHGTTKANRYSPRAEVELLD